MPDAPQIRRLEDHVINLIAAGEVVERPVSIVKELAENALDAGARVIDVSIEGGGIDRIRIRDDGMGIARDQLRNAVERHCTSKISHGAQLAAIETLGFRGEALASIAAVADLSVTSHALQSKRAWKLETVGGVVGAEPGVASHEQGTTIEVLNLFGRVPARRRFLKQARTEYLHVYQLIRQLAFCYPQVSVRLSADGRETFRVVGSQDEIVDIRRRRTIFGREFAELARAVELQADELVVRGWAGPAALARPRADLQFLAVNQRIVRDRSLTHAMRTAFAEHMVAGRYPSYALHIALPPSEVDVNVHPSKTEVRFRHPRQVHDALFSAVRRALDDEQPAKQTVYDSPDKRAESGLAAPAVRYQSDSKPRPRSPVENDAADSLVMVCGRFALLEGGEVPRVVDLAALIESLCRRRLLDNRAARPLIVPEYVAAPAEDLPGLAAMVCDCGIELSAIGPERWILRSVPVVFPPLDYQRFMSCLREAYQTGSDGVELVVHAAGQSFVVPTNRFGQQRWLAELLQQAHDLQIESHCFERDRNPQAWAQFLTD